MESSTPNSESVCPTCSQRYPPALTVCPHCGRDNANPFVSPGTMPVASSKEWRWLAPVALGVLLFAGLLAFVAPGLSILLVVLASPILARTWAAVERRKSPDRPATVHERMHALSASTGIVLVAALATSIAFAAVCVPVSLPFVKLGPGKLTPQEARTNEIGLFVAFASGGIAGLAAGFFVMRRFWPKKIE